MPDTAQLVATVENAWERAAPAIPKQIAKPTYDDEGVTAYFTGKTWSGHATSTLRALDFAPTILTNEAFAYFMPAYMLADIREPAEADTIVEALLFNLSSQPERATGIAAFLTETQRAAIANYLHHVRVREAGLYDRECEIALNFLREGGRHV